MEKPFPFAALRRQGKEYTFREAPVLSTQSPGNTQSVMRRAQSLQASPPSRGDERAQCRAVGAGAAGARPPARDWSSPVACGRLGPDPSPPQLLIVLVFLKVHSTRHSMKSLFHVRCIWKTLNLGPVSPANSRIAYEWACRSEQKGRPGLFSCVCPVPACPWQGWRLHADCIFWEGHTRALRVSPPLRCCHCGVCEARASGQHGGRRSQGGARLRPLIQ